MNGIDLIIVHQHNFISFYWRPAGTQHSVVLFIVILNIPRFLGIPSYSDGLFSKTHKNKKPGVCYAGLICGLV